MGTTPTYALPYPELTDPADAQVAVKPLADRIEALWNAGSPGLPLGTVVNSPLVWNGSRWVQSTGGLTFGNSDTYMSRGAAGLIDTNSLIRASGTTYGAGFQYWPPALGGNAFVASIQGDSYGRFAIETSGKQDWGPGGASSYDTNLYRAGVNSLWTDSTFRSQPASPVAVANATNVAFGFAVQREANYRLISDGSGKFSRGPGGASGADTNLYRAGTDLLRTDDSFYAAKDIVANYGNATAQIRLHPTRGIKFGSAP